MVSFSSFLSGMKNRPAHLAFLSVATLIAALFLGFNPRWETNDDVVMSMAAHGYGLAAYGTPNLIFSNVLWGYVVRTIPSINGVLGYSIATMAVLLVFGWATLYFLLRLGTGYLLGLLAVTALIVRPTLFPQFTINAGLLTVAAVIGWQVHARLGGKGNLVAACLLAFFGYLIRDKEFLLVLGVALPFLPWRALLERRQMRIAFLLLGVAIASAAAIDRWSYSGPEWQPYQNMNPNQAPLTDFLNYGAGNHLKQHPEILIRHHYSLNDVDLISDSFFVDPQIADPKSMKDMLAELSAIPMQEEHIKTGFVAVTALFGTGFLPVIVSSLLLLVLMPRWSVTFAWIFCLTALFATGFMGRPSILRVYVPLMALLLLAPLVVGKYREGTRKWMATLTLFIACVVNAFLFLPAALTTKQWIQQVQRDIHGLPAGPIVVWASNFPFELTFPVLANDTYPRTIKLYGLNAFTHAPFSLENTQQSAGRGMIERLQTATGIPIIASQRELEMLRIYCGERLNGQLRAVVTYQTPSLLIQQVRCAASE
jgi:MFS family permease